MCDVCVSLGFDRSCPDCGGFDWVSDGYLYQASPVAFMARLCPACRSAFLRVGAV